MSNQENTNIYHFYFIQIVLEIVAMVI